MEAFEYTVEKDCAGIRIDKYLSLQNCNITRSYIQKIIEQGNLLVNGASVKSNYKTRENDKIILNIEPPKELSVEAEDIKLDIIYEDEFLLVINKPQGMVVHPACGNYSGTLVNALMSHCKGSLSQINGVIRPGIVHRIDKDTSGLLVVAKTNEAHLSLAEQIKEHTVSRKYIAVVHGRFKNIEGTVDAPLGRHPVDRKKRCVTIKNSKSAVTHYKVLKQYSSYALIECRLETGRTHQIRVHMAYINHPLLGDLVYGLKKQPFKLEGQMLHAIEIGFKHPKTGEYMNFESPFPERFTNILSKLKE